MTEKLPIASPEQVLDCIEAWRRLDHSEASDEEIEGAISQLLQKLEH